jgi:hypothetical protein
MVKPGLRTSKRELFSFLWPFMLIAVLIYAGLGFLVWRWLT